MIKTSGQLQYDTIDQKEYLPKNQNDGLTFFDRMFSFNGPDGFCFLVPYYSWNKMQFSVPKEFNFYNIYNTIETILFHVSYDLKDKTLFCLGTQKKDSTLPVWYADCYYLGRKDYKIFYQPIANLKEMRVTNIFGIMKNMCLFLKHALYDARGNKRLQKSLFSVFMANAHAPIAWLFACYYSVILFIFSKVLLKGMTHLRILERLALVHFALHLFLNYVTNYRR